MLALHRDSPPDRRKGRAVLTTQPSAIHFNSSISTDSTLVLRLQFLSRRGVGDDRARLIAALLFGEAA